MRTLTVLLALVAATRAESLEAKLRKKLASPFVKNAAWLTDFDQAKQKAKASGKLLFAYFTRSYQP